MQQQVSPTNATQGAMNMNHGGHELFDVHEVLGCAINAMDQYMMLRQYVQDQELLKILDKQYQFMQSQYNVTAECFKTGQEPSQKTSTYLINEVLPPVYGLKPSQPKKPMQSISEINDAGVCAAMQGLVKSHCSLLTMSALETTNPVVRRVLAAQVQNFIEMSYELFMYQNKRAYYQVPQLAQADMQQMVNSFAPATGTPQMPQPNKGAALH
ncbi:spore coat protein [Paenibacillus sp. GCM10027626]|uniref:spore coat protein n=1 Tax=Paenibacillus sp. GCM10027626 TaxID=3273411 RepID=UPI00363507B1